MKSHARFLSSQFVSDVLLLELLISRYENSRMVDAGR